MSNENKSIHEFDFNLICEYFASVERQAVICKVLADLCR